MQPIRILIFGLDDDPDQIFLIETDLKLSKITNGVDVIFQGYTTIDAFFADFDQNPDIAVIDHYHGGVGRGFAIIDRIRELSSKCKIIVISGTDDTKTFIKYINEYKPYTYIDKNQEGYNEFLIEVLKTAVEDIRSDYQEEQRQQLQAKKEQEWYEKSINRLKELEKVFDQIKENGVKDKKPSEIK